MKFIASSIVILAAAILLVGGAFVKNGDTQVFVMAVGCIVGLTGLGGWFASIKQQ